MPRSAASNSVPGRRDRHPQRRVGLLVRLGQHGPGRHREELALVAEALLHPHLRDRVDELVPALLRLVGVGPEAAELGPRGRAAGAELEAAAGEDVEHGGPLGDADRVVELRDADDDAVADPDVLRLHGAGGEEQLGRRAVASTPRGSGARPPTPSRSRARRPGGPARARSGTPGARLSRVPRTRYRQLVEDAELHTRLQVDEGRRRAPPVAPQYGRNAAQLRSRSSRPPGLRSGHGVGGHGGRVRRDRDDGRADRRARRRRRTRRARVRSPAVRDGRPSRAPRRCHRRRRQLPARRACSCRCPARPTSRPP